MSSFHFQIIIYHFLLLFFLLLYWSWGLRSLNFRGFGWFLTWLFHLFCCFSLESLDRVGPNTAWFKLTVIICLGQDILNWWKVAMVNFERFQQKVIVFKLLWLDINGSWVHFVGSWILKELNCIWPFTGVLFQERSNDFWQITWVACGNCRKISSTNLFIQAW